MIKKLLRWLLYVLGGIVLLVFVAVLSLIRPDIPVERLLDKYTNETSSFVDVDGMRVHFMDEGDGPVLFLIHGTFASLHTWDAWTEALSDSFRVVRLDLPGFGLTGPQPDNDYSVRATLLVFEELRNHLGIDSWALAGNSLGARLAAEYGRHFPERTDGLIMLNGAGGLGVRPQAEPSANDTTQTQQNGQTARPQQPMVFRLLANPFLRNALSVMTPKFAFRHSLKEVYADPDKIEPETVTRYYELLRRKGNRSAFLTRNQGAFTDRSHLPELPDGGYLPEMDIPTLIIWGEKDTWIPAQTGRRLHNALPGSALIIYENAGHVPMEEIPDKSVRDARHFLRNHHQ